MTKRLLVTALVVLSMVGAAIANATEVTDPKASFSHYVELTPQQQKEITMISKAYIEKTRPIREELWAKKTMLQALTNNPNAEVKDIQKIVNAMKELRSKLHAERVVFEQGMKGKYGFIPNKNWTDKNDAFLPAGSDTDSVTKNTQTTENSTSESKSFFSKLFN